MLVYMLLFQTPNIDALLLCMAATMDPSSPVACCEHVLGVIHGSPHSLQWNDLWTSICAIGFAESCCQKPFV